MNFHMGGVSSPPPHLRNEPLASINIISQQGAIGKLMISGLLLTGFGKAIDTKIAVISTH